jgi:hypothetical protein
VKEKIMEIPSNIKKALKQADRSILLADRQATRNQRNKHYDYMTYLKLLDARRERERVTGKKERGPLV